MKRTLHKRYGSLQPRTLLALLTLSLAAPLAHAAEPASSAAQIQRPVFACGSGLAAPAPRKDKIFESVPARPLALSDDGSLLYVINSPANCLEIYRVDGDTLTLASSIAVGVDPVAVAVRSATEAWVVNHISNSVSIVNIQGQPHIERTLQVGDEPWDIVFANSSEHGADTAVNNRNRAFISASFRGQNHPQFKVEYLLMNRLDPQPGEDKGAASENKGELIGRADLWVFDVDGKSQPQLSGLINTFTSSLRSLAVDTAGNRVFASAFKSGNRTAVTPIPFDGLIGDKWSAEGVGNLEPFAIVQQRADKQWVDANGVAWPMFMSFDVADNDLFVIDATAPLRLGNADRPIFNRQAIAQTVEGIGSVLFNSYFDAARNRLLISSVDADNLIPMQEKLKGVFVGNHLKVVDFNQSPATVASIDLDALAGADQTDAKAKPGLALPAGLLATAAAEPGDTAVLVTAMGTNQIVSFDLDRALAAAARPAANTADKSTANAAGNALRKLPSANGPIAIIKGATADTFYSYNYISNTVALLRTTSSGLDSVFTASLANPELDAIKRGRRYLYDATLTSGNNRVACASCHIFGGDDKLQWVTDKSGERLVYNRVPFIEHGNRKTTARAIRFNRDVATSKVGDQVPFADTTVPIRYIGDQKGFADRVDSGEIQLGQDGLVYLTESEYDRRLSRFKILTGKPTWVLIETPFLQALRGPMRTTPLYGIADSGAMHYLGDKAGLAHASGPCSDPNDTQEQRAFKEFNTPCGGGPGNFQTLMGGPQIARQPMADLSAFSFALSYPPNPIRPLDNQVNVKGEQIFNHQKIGVDLSNWDDVVAKTPLIFGCSDCHTVAPGAKMFGTSKKIYSAPPLSVQDAKVPHLRFLYDRAGFLRGDYRTTTDFLNMKPNSPHYDTVVHAQGLNHGGWFDFSMFFANYVWIVNPSDPTAATPESKEKYFNLFTYLMEFDTNYLPMYGKQITVHRDELKDGKVPDQVAVFVANALHPKSNDNRRQCDVHVSAPVTANASTASTRTIKNISELASIVKNSALPLTLTCL